MDINLVVLVGRLVSSPDHRFDSGSEMVRFLVAVRSENPARIDVLPVVFWDPPPGSFNVAVGQILRVAGRVQRRFWEDGSDRRSRLELVADHVEAVDSVTV